MTIGTPTAVALDGRDAMLAVAMNGEPLPPAHGYPVRMVVPGLYGYVSATKWLVDLELTTFGCLDPYWVERGWAAKAPIKTMSRIDAPKPLARLAAGPRRRSPASPGRSIVASNGSRSASTTARGWRPELGGRRLARYLAPVGLSMGRRPGQPRLEVRATDATGVIQTDVRAEPFPERRHRLALRRRHRDMSRAPSVRQVRWAAASTSRRPRRRPEQGESP